MGKSEDSSAASLPAELVASNHFSQREHFGGLQQGLLDFVEPLLAEGDGSEGHLEQTLRLGQFCWQLALSSPEERAEKSRVLEEELCTSAEQREALRSLIGVMVERHRTLFPWLHSSGVASKP